MSFTTRFQKDEQGSIAMIFGMVIIVLALFSGIAIDVSRAYGVSSFVSSALDSTALATARELQKRDMTDQEASDFANLRYSTLVSGRDGSGVTYQPVVVQVNRVDETVRVTSSSVVPTYFAGLAGQDTLNVSESTTVSYNVRVVELAMVVDVTGSMNTSSGTTTRIEGLRLAASDLVRELVPDNPRAKSNRVALAPYAAAVNAGSLVGQLTGPGNDSADGCVIGRDGDDALTDAAPGTDRWLTAFDPANPVIDVDPTSGASDYACPAAEVLPLSKNRGDLLAYIDSFSPNGYTAGHLGAAWGWYLVSRKWSAVFGSGSEPAPDTDEDTIKAVLLMTDGQFNTRFVGESGDTSDEQARAICANMQQANVLVYAVAFDAPPAAEETLRACATSDEFYFEAANSDQLRAAFREIANNLTSLRLTK